MTRPTAKPGEAIILARHTPSSSAWLRLRRLGMGVPRGHWRWMRRE